MKQLAGEGSDDTELSEVARIADLEHQVNTLEAGLAANRVSGMAVGLLMAQYGLTRDEGFALLAKQSQHTNTKVATLALGLVLAAEARAASRRP